MGQPITQRAWVLARLEADAAAGREGLTPFEAAAVGILRLGAIIFDLREAGYVIEDTNVKPGGGRFERYSMYALRLRPGDGDA